MNENDQRNIKDFFDHRKLVLERIQLSLKKEKERKKGKKP